MNRDEKLNEELMLEDLDEDVCLNYLLVGKERHKWLYSGYEKRFHKESIYSSPLL